MEAFLAILELCAVVLKVFGPSAARVVDSVVNDRDPVADLAAEDTSTILTAEGRLERAMAETRAHEAARKVREAHANGETDGMSAQQLAVVAHAISVHDLVAVGT